MNRFVKIILLSNLATIVLTAIAVLLALHWDDNYYNTANHSLKTTTTLSSQTFPFKLNNNGRRFLQQDDDDDDDDEQECCDCDTEEPEGTPAWCFSGSTSTVQVGTTGGDIDIVETILMKDLKLGQNVYVGNGQYEKVYSFGHYYNPTATTKGPKKSNSSFIRVSSEGAFIDLTRNHMVWRMNTNSFVAASELKMGDTLLFDKNDNHRSNLSSSIRITSITSIPIPKGGYMAPFTPSGKIVVNGIMASSFVDLFDDTTTKVLLPFKKLSPQWIAHAFEFPHRMICSGASLFCGTETYDENGISNWVSKPLQLSQYWISSLSSSKEWVLLFFHMPLFAIFVLTLSIFTIMESSFLIFGSDHHTLMLLFGGIMMAYYYYTNKKSL